MPSMIPSWVRTPISRLRHTLAWSYQQVTFRSQALPDFIIIGAMKSGTSSLFDYLGQHPQLFPSSKKEVHFFDGGLTLDVDDFAKGQAWYRAHFPPKKQMSADSKTFEASPLYMFNPLVPKRVFNLIPKVKIIAILRNPTERAISHYFHEKRKGNEPLSIYEALQEEENRLESVIKVQDYKSKTFRQYSYKSRGLYKQQIEGYLNYFSWQQILILSSEELFSEPDSTLRRVLEFVGADPEFKIKDLEARNVATNRSNVDPKVYDYLNNYFLPHNQALYELIEKSYDW